MKNILSKTFLWDLSLLIVALVWGVGFVITKNALSVITPLYFLSIRFLIAGIFMVIIFHKQLRQASKQDLIGGCIIGVFLSLGFITQTVGINFTTPAKSSFITGLNVVLVPFIAIISTHKSPRLKAVVSALVAFIGLSLISLNGNLAIGLGDALTVLCAIFFACHIVSVGHFAYKSNVYVIATIQMVFSSIVCTVLAIVLEPFPSFSGVGIWSGILYTSFLSTLAAFLIQNLAQKNTPSTHAAIILCLESVFGALASVLFWHEVMTEKMIIGCVLIFAAILFNEIDFRMFKTSRVLNK